MKAIRVLLQVLCSILLISLSTSFAVPRDAASGTQASSPLTVEQAFAIAQDQVLRSRNTIPGWEGATLDVPQVHYDLGGRVAAYVFSVVKDGEDAGYITVSGQALPNPVLEFSTAPARYKTAQPAVRATAERLGLVIEEQKPLYLGLLAYFYRIGDQEPVQLMEMNTRKIISLDASSLSPAQQQTGSRPDSSDVSLDPLLTEIARAGAAPQSTSYKLLYGPDYDWYRGCGPTAVANAMGHWADRGYPDLVYGGSDGDYRGTIDQLADLMGTSPQGWTWLPIDDDIKNFAALRGYAFESGGMDMPSYATFVGEIDAHRPIVVLVNGHVFYGDHFITGFGYEYDPADPNYRYMIVHDTWGSTPEVYWVQYGAGYGHLWFDTVVPPVVQVDTVPPASAVNPSSNYQTSDVFDVSWSGTDAGWGIRWYDIQHRNGQTGEWVDWFTHTTLTQAAFAGVRGQTYCFRSRAMDIDHNQEPYPADADTCTTVPPLLTINYPTGKPGSIFTLTGSKYPPSTAITVTINGDPLGVVPTDPAGGLSFLLDTSQADAGGYLVTTTAGFDVSVGFKLDPDFPLRPEEGSGTTFVVPGGIALTEYVYFSIVQR